jgi:Protein of unknown function (DUF3606)
MLTIVTDVFHILQKSGTSSPWPSSSNYKDPKRGNMSEHHDAPKAHEAHAIHEDHTKGPHDPKEINPKMASDIAYWSKEFDVTGDKLHEAIRAHGTHVEKVRAALCKAS